MMPYSRISTEMREALIRVYEDGRDFILTAENLNINRRTAYGIIQRYQRTGRIAVLPRGGDKASILTNEMKAALVNFVEEKPTITLDELRAKLVDTFPDKPMVSRMTISRALDGSLITLKLLRTIPTQWNTDEVKDARKTFVEWLLREYSSKTLIYLDECGFNIWTARSQGRAFRGQRAVRVVCGQRGKNMTALLAVSPKHGLVHNTIIEGGMTKELFADFLSEISALLQEEDIVVIFDNAPAHRVPPALGHSHEMHALPKYSPVLNITERAISCLKSHAKRRLSDPSVQAHFHSHIAAAQAGKTLHRHRMDNLRTIIEACMPEITVEKCSQWFNHMFSYFPACMNKNDIFF